MRQDLWDRVQARMIALPDATGVPISHKQRKYLLSGFVLCGVCGGHYTITTPYSYRCGTFRNRGDHACSNHLAVSRRRLEGAVIAALRDKLYTADTLSVIIERVRRGLEERARQHAAAARQEDRAKVLRCIEAEIDNIKQAVRMGKATATLLEMLEDAERRRTALRDAGELPVAVPSSLTRLLERLPEVVKARLDDLDTLLAAQQVEKGKAILAALGMGITLKPCGDHLEAEISGKAECLFLLAATNNRAVQLRWLGEEDSNPRPLTRPTL